MFKIGIDKFGTNSFRIFREDFEGYEHATLLEFNPPNSDLPGCMSLEFAEEIVKMWNERTGK